MITYGDIREGFKRGVIKLVPSPNGDGIHDTACQIGQNWFYFGGQEAEVSTPEEFLANVGPAFAAEYIYHALNDVGGYAGIQSTYPDEYAYYESILSEAGCTGHTA